MISSCFEVNETISGPSNSLCIHVYIKGPQTELLFNFFVRVTDTIIQYVINRLTCLMWNTDCDGLIIPFCLCLQMRECLGTCLEIIIIFAIPFGGANGTEIAYFTFKRLGFDEASPALEVKLFSSILRPVFKLFEYFKLL